MNTHYHIGKLFHSNKEKQKEKVKTLKTLPIISSLHIIFFFFWLEN